jgi:hypothetical protein
MCSTAGAGADPAPAVASQCGGGTAGRAIEDSVEDGSEALAGSRLGEDSPAGLSLDWR